MSHRVLGVIPARLASTRLPEKPLYPILGHPLIEWVWRRVSTMRALDEVVVATDSERIAEVCRGFGASVVLTSSEHESGTDRVAEVAGRSEYRGFTHVANVQGDEPLMRDDHVRKAVSRVTELGWDVGTCACPVGGAEAYHDVSVVKVAADRQGRALYFSRAPIPYRRDGAPDAEAFARAPFLRHVGLYTYTRTALDTWVGMDPSPLERVEHLEQLRALEGGLRIGVAVVDRAAPGIDTPDDVVRIERHLNEQGITTFA
jgi:3-deoxy-manno-octulosonate cytidylyltransferase (CMP-KDO synthetase)